MEETCLRFEVEAASPGAGNRLAADLKAMLESSARGISVRRSKTDYDTLDLGTIITVVVSSPVALAAVKALAAWLLKHPDGSLVAEVEESEGRRTIRLNAKGLTDEQLERQLSRLIQPD